MANIASLSVQLTAKIGSFSKRLGRARKLLKRFAKGVSQIISRIAKVTAGLAVAATAAITAMAVSSAKSIDDLAKASDKLGIPIAQLRALQFAAKQTGVEARTLTMAVQRMTRRVAEAAMDTGEAKDAIKQLGLEAKVLARLSPDRQFAMISEAMKKVTSSGERVRLAFKLFDSEGVAVVNTLRLGVDGLEKMGAEINRLRGNINRFDAAKIEEANDTFSKILEVIKGVGDAIAIQLAPLVVGIGNKFIDVATEGDRMGHVVEESFQAMVKGIGFVGNAVQRGIIVPFKLAQRVILGFSELALNTLANVILKMADFADAVKRLPGIGKIFKDISTVGDRLLVGVLQAGAADARKQIDALSESIENIKAKPFSESFDKFVKTAFEDAARNARKVVDGLKPVADGVRKLSEDADDASDKVDKLSDAMKRLQGFTQGRASLLIPGGTGIKTSARAQFAGPLPRGNVQTQRVQTQPLVPLTKRMLAVLTKVSVNTRVTASNAKRVFATTRTPGVASRRQARLEGKDAGGLTAFEKMQETIRKRAENAQRLRDQMRVPTGADTLAAAGAARSERGAAARQLMGEQAAARSARVAGLKMEQTEAAEALALLRELVANTRNPVAVAG